MKLKKQLPIIGKNMSYYYLMPLLGYTAAFYGDMLLNTYIINKYNAVPDEYEQTRGIFHFLFDYKGDVTFDKFENILRKHKDYITHADIYNGAYTLYSFYIPKEFQTDFKRFKMGKYSELSGDAKIQIAKSFGPTTRIYKSLFTSANDRVERLRYMKKVWDLDDKTMKEIPKDIMVSRPDLEKETFVVKDVVDSLRL